MRRLCRRRIFHYTFFGRCRLQLQASGGGLEFFFHLGATPGEDGFIFGQQLGFMASERLFHAARLLLSDSGETLF